MANFEKSLKFKAKDSLSVDVLKDFIKEQLNKTCKYQVISEEGKTLSVKGGVKESFFTPVTTFQASFDSVVEGDVVRMTMNGNSKPNWIFVTMFVLGIVGTFIPNLEFLVVVLFGSIGLFLFQRNHPQRTCEEVLNAIDTEFSVL